ncbi:MAG: hypothetical protein AVDCRST_MAG28-1947, partial [uncultured Rubrobacteraceae bacterium]
GSSPGDTFGARGGGALRGAGLLPDPNNLRPGEHRRRHTEGIQQPVELPLQDSLRCPGHRAADRPPRPGGHSTQREPRSGGGGLAEHRRSSGADHRGRQPAGRSL